MNSISPIKVSVVVNVYNEEAVILTVLQSIRESWFPGMEVIISDDGSTDRTAEIVKEFKEKNDAEWLILYSHENLRHAGARNAGAKIAKGEYLFFMDGDTTLPKGLVENSLRELESKHFDVVSHYFKS